MLIDWKDTRLEAPVELTAQVGDCSLGIKEDRESTPPCFRWEISGRHCAEGATPTVEMSKEILDKLLRIYTAKTGSTAVEFVDG